ncbi:hypothetical protein DV737_g5385, partial [Chaetothyriales sp. CBS 132003]
MGVVGADRVEQRSSPELLRAVDMEKKAGASHDAVEVSASNSGGKSEELEDGVQRVRAIPGTWSKPTLIRMSVFHTSNFTWTAYAGVSIMLLGTVLLIALRSPSTEPGVLALTQILVGLGSALFTVCGQLAVMAPLTHQQLAVVNALSGLFGGVGAAIGLAIAGAMRNKILPKELYRRLPADSKDQAGTIFGNMVVQMSFESDTPARAAMVASYSHVMRLMVIAGACLMPSCLISILVWKKINVKKLEEERGKQTKGTVSKAAAATAAADSAQKAPVGQQLATGPVTSAVTNGVNATSGESTAANQTPLTHYHSFFYDLLSWSNPRATAVTFASTVLFILASRYLPIVRWLLKISWITLGVVTLSEVASKALLGSSVASSIRPRRYYTIPKETLEATLEDVQHLVNFFVIEVQRIVFAENVPVTAAAFVTAFLSSFLIKLLPAWGLALLGTTVVFIAPLIYIKNQELIDGHLTHAHKLATEQATQIRQIAGHHAGKGYEAVKGYTGDYANKAGVFVGQARQTIPLVSKAKPSVKESDFPKAPAHDLPIGIFCIAGIVCIASIVCIVSIVGIVGIAIISDHSRHDNSQQNGQQRAAISHALFTPSGVSRGIPLEQPTYVVTPDMASFEQKLAAITTPGDDQKLPGVVLTAISSSPSSIVKEVYHQSFGTSSLDPDKSHPLSRNSLFWIASCTKLLTSLSVLQLVERRLIGLDDPVEGVVPELKDPDILVGFTPDGQPKLTKAKHKITVRHLITHTSGLAYDFLHPKIARWWKWKGVNPLSVHGEIAAVYSTPLIFEPGTSWSYSPGLDWAGVLIARLTGHKQLGGYIKQHIFAPLGITAKDAAFRKSDFQLASDAEWDQRWADLTIRLQPSGQLDLAKPSYDGALMPAPSSRSLEPTDDFGGGGLLMSPDAYIKVLASILSDDGKLLKRGTVANLFVPAIGEPERKALIAAMHPDAGGRMLTGGLPLPSDSTVPDSDKQEYHHGLAGLLNRPKSSTGAWTLSWSGLPNLFWWIDRENGLAGMYAGQIIPSGDPWSLDMEAAWRKEMVHRFGRANKSPGPSL